MSDLDKQNCLYEKAIQLLQEVKLVSGPTGLAGTLRRHDDLKTFITKVQKERIKIIEDNIPNHQMDFINSIDN